MFIKVKALNFLSFKEGIEVSFELGKSQFSSFNAYSAIGVFGANSSGKSNLLRIFSTLKNICCNSANSNPEDPRLVTPFYNSSNEISFYVEFVINEVLYRYEIDLTPDRIISESIHRKEKGRNWVKIIIREETDLIYLHQDFKDLKSLGTIRSSASIISVAHYLGKESLSSLYYQFNSIWTNIEGRGTSRILDYNATTDIYNSFPDVFSFVKNIIIKADLGISDINISSTKTEEGKESYYPIFTHNSGKKKHLLLYHQESGGTQTLYTTLVEYAIALNNGGLLVIDEIEINLHPLLYPILLNLFLNPDLNIKRAQILFTTHREDLFDTLGKYQCIITDKKDNESCAYRLDNLPDGVIRNDRPITPLYLKGLLGGIPLISELLNKNNLKKALT